MDDSFLVNEDFLIAIILIQLESNGWSGRVNLIGEHIDYEGYSVLPMAIRQDTIVAIRKSESSNGPRQIHVANARPEQYEAVSFSVDPHQVINHHYVRSHSLQDGRKYHI